jgi:putative membrane protein
MIVKRNFNPIRVWEYIQRPMLLGILWPMIVWVIYYFSNRPEMALNFTPVGVLGSALAIFVAFRNNSAYNRWWEARTLWGGIVNSSRVLSRLIITFTDSHSHQPQFDRERSDIFKKTMIYLCIAWAHALRLHLRKQESWDELKPYIPESDRTALVKCQHKPNFIMMSMGKRIYEAMANGTLGGFDSFQMEGQMLALCNYQGSCERIKDTPLPRQYDFFTRLFQSGNLVFFSWLIIPLSILISGVFVIMERTGAANENPFENLITDIPMTAICNNIERDLLEMLGENPLPPETQPLKGYLF